MVQQRRLQKIIEICMLNKDVNEKWTRKLNYFISNMSKMAKKIQEKISKAERDSSELQKLITALDKVQRQKNQDICDFIDYANHNLNEQVKLDNTYISTFQENPEGNTVEYQKFEERQLDQQGQISAPKQAQTALDKLTDKKNQQMLDEFRSDLDRLAKMLDISPQELMRSRGRLNGNKKFESKLLFIQPISILPARNSIWKT